MSKELYVANKNKFLFFWRNFMNKHKSFAAVGAVLLLSAAVALGAPQLSLRMQENKL